jgi:hypothetical protein
MRRLLELSATGGRGLVRCVALALAAWAAGLVQPAALHADAAGPQLEITRTCEAPVAGRQVTCRITVRSLGSAAPSGPVRVADAATLVDSGEPVALVAVDPDGPEWSCGAMPSASLSCRISGELLAPGASRHIDVTLIASPRERFRACAQGTYGPAAGDLIVHPIGEACQEGGGTLLDVEMTGEEECPPGQPCAFQIAIRNDGAAAFDGVVRIGEAIAADGSGRLEGLPIVELDRAFGCAAEPTALPFACDAHLSLRPGESRVHGVTVVMPDDIAAGDKGISGRNCVAVLKPGTPVTAAAAGSGSGAGASGDGDALSRTVACHAFRIATPHPKRPSCAAGLVPDVAGQCVCPQGTTLKNGACRKVEVPPVRQCKLLPGMIRTTGGDCICPRGTELRSGACREVEAPPIRQCKLLPGMIRTESGRCICPRGTELRSGACRKVEVPPVRQCKLLPGMIRTEAGRCICPRGTELRNGACRKPEVRQACAAGTIGTFPNCRKVRIAPGFVVRPRVFNPRPHVPDVRQPTVRQPTARVPVVRTPVTRTPVVRQPTTRVPVVRRPRIPGSR